MAKLWEKEGITLNPIIESYTVGDDYLLDKTLMPYDIEGTIAHVKGLAKIGLLTMKESGKIHAALGDLKQAFENGEVTITIQDEDCHTVIEHYLVTKLGSLGKKVHTGRSRNDQVLTAMRLYMKDQLLQVMAAAKLLKKAFLIQSKKHKEMPMPGYSHTKQAMVSSVGHYLASFVESLQDDISLLGVILHHVDKSPLGSVAGFGSTLPLDRTFTAKELGFSTVQMNSLYCQVSRGKYESLVLEGLVQIMLTLGRFAHDMLLFTSDEFGFFDVDISLTTGSSIMPHKKNLDALEIMRSSTSVVMGSQHIVQNISQKLLSGYNRDLQLIKKELMQSCDIVTTSLSIAYIFIEGLNPNKKKIEQSMCKKMLMADLATALVLEKNIPFRDAYVQTAGTVDTSKPDYIRSIKEKVSLGSPGNLGLELYTE